MSIVSVEITEDSGSAPRVLRYRLTDSVGGTHHYEMFSRPDFDAESFKSVLSAEFAEKLAQREFDAAVETG